MDDQKDFAGSKKEGASDRSGAQNYRAKMKKANAARLKARGIKSKPGEERKAYFKSSKSPAKGNKQQILRPGDVKKRKPSPSKGPSDRSGLKPSAKRPEKRMKRAVEPSRDIKKRETPKSTKRPVKEMRRQVLRRGEADRKKADTANIRRKNSAESRAALRNNKKRAEGADRERKAKMQKEGGRGKYTCKC